MRVKLRRSMGAPGNLVKHLTAITAQEKAIKSMYTTRNRGGDLWPRSGQSLGPYAERAHSDTQSRLRDF
jgi:hypothetical protein